MSLSGALCAVAAGLAILLVPASPVWAQGGSDAEWKVLTVARNGAWGLSTARLQGDAIAGAVHQCELRSADHERLRRGAGRLSDRLGPGHPVRRSSRAGLGRRPRRGRDGRRRTTGDAGTVQPRRPAGMPSPVDGQSCRRDHDRSRAEGRSAAAAGLKTDHSSGSPLSLDLPVGPERRSQDPGDDDRADRQEGEKPVRHQRGVRQEAPAHAQPFGNERP